MQQQPTGKAVYSLPPYLRPYSGYPIANNYGSSFSPIYPLPHPPPLVFNQPENSAVSVPACYPTPSGSSSSPSDSSDEGNSPLENQGTQRPLFRPVDFERSDPKPSPSKATCFPPTPSDSHCSDSPPSPSRFHGVTVSVLDKDLWDAFSRVGNEMIVTKPGRRLFPALLVSVRGLTPSVDYSITLRIFSADECRYKFLNNHWVGVGESEILQNERRQVFRHPNSPSSGEFWMKKPISFKNVKISHSPSSKHGNILLYTMHKYVMEVVIDATGRPPIVIRLPETEFVAVTSYQNSLLTQLKIDNNPFAKGFRDKEDATMRNHYAMFAPHPLWKVPCHLPYIVTDPASYTPAELLPSVNQIARETPSPAEGQVTPPVPLPSVNQIARETLSPAEGQVTPPTISSPPSLVQSPAALRHPPYPYPFPWSYPSVSYSPATSRRTMDDM